MTRWPSLARRSHKWEPMNPAPPVTKTSFLFIMLEENERPARERHEAEETERPRRLEDPKEARGRFRRFRRQCRPRSGEVRRCRGGAYCFFIRLNVRSRALYRLDLRYCCITHRTGRKLPVGDWLKCRCLSNCTNGRIRSRYFPARIEERCRARGWKPYHLRGEKDGGAGKDLRILGDLEFLPAHGEAPEREIERARIAVCERDAARRNRSDGDTCILYCDNGFHERIAAIRSGGADNSDIFARLVILMVDARTGSPHPIAERPRYRCAVAPVPFIVVHNSSKRRIRA